MPTYEQYWCGFTRATVTARQCHSAFIRASRPSIENPTATLRFMNRAFDLYYRTIQAALTWRDTDRADATIASLKASATDGSTYYGVSDLSEAFEHLAQPGGVWTDHRFAVYEGVSSDRDKYKCFRGRYIAPVALVNFINSVDEKRKLLFEHAGTFSQHMNTASRALRQNGAWSGLVDFADFMATWSDHVGDLMWATKALHSSESVAGQRFRQALGQLGNSLDTIGAVVERTGEISTIVEAVTGGLNTMTRLERLPVSGAQDIAYGLASLRVVCAFLPVLGDFYCEAIDTVSDVATEFARLIRNRCAMLDEIGGMPPAPRGLGRPAAAQRN